jgi:cytochrome b561
MTWSRTSKAFHWAGAAFIIYLLIHGFWMVGLPRELRFSHYETHAAAGYLFIALTLARLVWRWTHEVPPQPAGAARWEKLAAHAGHWALYALMLAAALSGWALAGTFKRPLDSVFGAFRVPPLVSDASLHGAMEQAHVALSYALALLLVVHIASAFYHYWWKKDDVMQRMVGSGRGAA